MIDAKEKAKVIEVVTDLPRTELKSETTRDLPKKIPYKAHAKGNLLGRKPTPSRKPTSTKT